MDDLRQTNERDAVQHHKPLPVDSHEEAYALMATFYTEHYRRLVDLVGRRFPTLSGDDVVQDLFGRILNGVDASTGSDLTHYVHRWTQPGYVTQAVVNACLDQVRSSARTSQSALDPGGFDATPGAELVSFPADYHDPNVAPTSPEEVPVQLASLRRRAAIRTLLQALYERGKRTPRRQPYLTDRQLQTLTALYDSDEGIGDDASLDDQQLHSLALHRNERARERWRDQQGYSDPESGRQIAAAARLGISKQAVSKSQRMIRASMVLAHYVAGVLSPERTLLNPEAIHRHLDAYDQFETRSGIKGGQQRLAVAAPAVATTAATGTRVQTERLTGTLGIHLVEAIAHLHEVEQSFAELTATSDPNCVAVCEVHTRRADRTTEIYF